MMLEETDVKMLARLIDERHQKGHRPSRWSAYSSKGVPTLGYFFSVVPSIITTQLVPSSDISQLKLIFLGVTSVIV